MKKFSFFFIFFNLFNNKGTPVKLKKEEKQQHYNKIILYKKMFVFFYTFFLKFYFDKFPC